MFLLIFLIRIFSANFETSGSMILRLVPEIEGGYPERDGEEGKGGEGLVLEYSRSWICNTCEVQLLQRNC